MERDRSTIQPVERLGKVSPVLPIRFFYPLPEQSELRKKQRQKTQQKQQKPKETENKFTHKEGSIDLKA